MNVHSQPAEAEEEKGSKIPMSWNSNIKEHFCFQEAVIRAMLCLYCSQHAAVQKSAGALGLEMRT